MNLAKSELLALVKSSYTNVNKKQRRLVFDDLDLEIKSKSPFRDSYLLNDVKAFCNASQAGEYYAPFEINSKKYTSEQQLTLLNKK